jgi:hypothetical protein
MLTRNSNAAHPLTARALRVLLKVFPAPGGRPQHARQLVDDIQPMEAIDLQTVENRHEIGRDTSALVVAQRKHAYRENCGYLACLSYRKKWSGPGLDPKNVITRLI